ncbi:Mov34/MPN/PAD-1 family protein [Streptomyces sp. NPDC002248]
MTLVPPDPSEASLRRIARIGEFRKPREACGLLLFRDGVEEVVELENHSDSPEDSYEAETADMLEYVEGLESHQVVIWHTHPRGLIGPSRGDMRFRPPVPGLHLMVVTLTEGEPVATRF